MLDFLKSPVKAFQDFIVLGATAFRNIFRTPHYSNDIFIQMDVIGVGSLPIVMMIGFFSGVVMALQMSRALSNYGAQGKIGEIVSITLVRELGPVLTAILVAGRNASGMASELGSMKVTEQIDAMRALGTDPSKKLVTPRVISSVSMLFFLTLISDLVGLSGGAMVSTLMLGLNANQYWSKAWQSLVFEDVFMGLTKPILFGFILSTVGCYYGMSTKGGTQGVCRATTQAVVAASVLILIVDFFWTRLLMVFMGGG